MDGSRGKPWQRPAAAPWLEPPPLLTLPADEVHVWRAGLDLDEPTLERLLPTLSGDERARAARFYFRQDRGRFIAARGLLRAILARYLGTNPGELRFHYGRHGKPMLPGEDLRFNLSHSHGLAIYALARGREVGIDLELIRADFPWLTTAERFFSPWEIAMLRSLPPERQRAVFFACWTRREASAKARGVGMANLFSPSEEGHASLRAASEIPWAQYALAPGPGYAASLVVEGESARLRLFQWVEG